MSNTPHRILDVGSSGPDVRPAERVKSWIERLENPMMVQGAIRRPSTPNFDHDQVQQSTNPSVRGSKLDGSQSVILSRCRTPVANGTSEPVRETRSVSVSISRSYVPSTPSRAPKRPGPPTQEDLQAVSPSSRTPSKKAHGSGGANELNTPRRVREDSIEDGDSPLGAPRNLVWSPQSQRSRSFRSSPGSPLPFLIRRGQHTPVPVRFREMSTSPVQQATGHAVPVIIKIEDDIFDVDESGPRPEPRPKQQVGILVIKDEEDEAALEGEELRREEAREKSPVFTSLADIWSQVLAAQPQGQTNRAIRLLTPTFPLHGPPCLECNRPSTFGRVSAQNPNGNAHRPFYRCNHCNSWTTWADLRGVRPENRPCDCGMPSRECLTGTRAMCGPGKQFWVCPEGRCSFFSWE